ncbi:vesicle-associated membrane protein 4-like isoform X2 [Mytilus edulis]|uniref:vesicle-associated membrane protein 4-like isoform X2 n=1 Tax=Mytilus edulis TaxID=6550 RepID=UPI0039F02EBA
MSSHNTDHIDRLQGDVNEVTHLLKDNVEKVLERGEKIEDLQNRSEDLTASSIQFKSRSRDLRRKMCFTVKPWDKDSGSGHHKNETYIMST